MGSGKPRVKLPVLSPWQVKAIGALEESIAHWDRLASGRRRAIESLRASDCACCEIWYTGGCEGCPVLARTGIAGCKGSPYWDAVRARSRCGYNLDAPEFRAAAKVEADWLRDTLEMVKSGEVKP